MVCRQLGLTGGQARRHAHYGAGTGPTWLDQVACTGTEDCLDDCPANDWGDENCVHSEDAGVKCKYLCDITKS